MSEIDATAQRSLLERELASALADYDYYGTIGAQSAACIAIDAYVDALRLSGTSPETMIDAIKDVATRAGYRATPGGSAPRRVPDMRIDAFLSRAIARYFGAQPSPDAIVQWVPVAVVC